MADIALRQIRAIIAVIEEGSFTRAATRENATQSGISQHVAAAERTLGVKLFERTATGTKPTPAGQRYYKRCLDVIGELDSAREEVRGFASRVSGDLRIGMIPTLTRAALAPALDKFTSSHPDVRCYVVEGYSPGLTDLVSSGELDFAVVPTSEGRVGLRSRLLVRDREMLVSNAKSGLKPWEPIRLKDLGPLKIIVPGPGNVRRRNMEVYFQTHGVEVAQMIELDAMISTLQMIVRSDWVAILSGMICAADIGRDLGRVINPIYDPPMIADFIVISPARRTLTAQAQLFLECFEAEITAIQNTWAKIIPPAVYPVRRRAGAR